MFVTTSAGVVSICTAPVLIAPVGAANARVSTTPAGIAVIDHRCDLAIETVIAPGLPVRSISSMALTENVTDCVASLPAKLELQERNAAANRPSV